MLYRRLLSFSLFIFFSIQLSAQLKVGAEKLNKYLPKLKGKQIALVANQSSIVGEEHLLDVLLKNEVAVQKIFSLEHGFRGTEDAGKHLDNSKDEKTGLPIISLYGKHKKPTPADLRGIDVVFFDIQDVGVRFYTYISSLHYIMEGCAENNVEIMVLDRPNPNIELIDGPVLEPEFTSFVGMHSIPVAHGMTIGEYARMVNGECWLNDSVQCELKVIPCENYTRTTAYELPIKPSPNLPNAQAVRLYPSLCFFEGTTVSVGRGTDFPFQVFGSPDFKGKFSFTFTPKPNGGSTTPKHTGKVCYGRDLRSESALSQLNLSWLLEAYRVNNNKNEFFNSFFTKLAGTKKLEEQIIEGANEEEIRNSWQVDLEEFTAMRKQYLLY